MKKDFRMDMLSKIQNKLLQRKANSVIRKVKYSSLATAKSIGIIFDATDEENYLKSIQFIKTLNKNQIQTQAIGFLKKRDTENHLPLHPGVRYTPYSSITPYSKIKDKNVRYFLSKEFDILISLNLEKNFSIKLLIALSKAKLKVTQFSEPYLYDIQIVAKNKNLDFYSKQILHYLSTIKYIG